MVARIVILVACLVITIAVGWWRFVFERNRDVLILDVIFLGAVGATLAVLIILLKRTFNGIMAREMDAASDRPASQDELAGEPSPREVFRK